MALTDLLLQSLRDGRVGGVGDALAFVVLHFDLSVWSLVSLVDLLQL
jgi:hypothetical protein